MIGMGVPEELLNDILKSRTDTNISDLDPCSGKVTNIGDKYLVDIPPEMLPKGFGHMKFMIGKEITSDYSFTDTSLTFSNIKGLKSTRAILGVFGFEKVDSIVIDSITGNVNIVTKRRLLW